MRVRSGFFVIAVLAVVGIFAASVSALSGVGSRGFAQAGPLAGAGESGDLFGESVAIGDFNGDDNFDLVFGMPGEDLGLPSQNKPNAGGITVLYGSNGGTFDLGDSAQLTAEGAMAGAPESLDYLGRVLAVGDFDQDGYDDVAVGASGEQIFNFTNAGAVIVMYGSASGLGPNRSVQLTQTGPIPGASESSDQWGEELEVGDWNDDGYPDLAIGARGESVGNKFQSGAVTIVPGSASGLDINASTAFSQAGVVVGAAESADFFGDALQTGDYDGDGVDDLAIGVSAESLGSAVATGAVVVIPGSSSGLVLGQSKAFSQNGAVPGVSEPWDRFGSTLASGDFDNDGYDDLAIGSPGEDIGSSTTDHGAVTVLYGTPNGLSSSGADAFSEAGAVSGAPEAGDMFGSVLVAGDFDGDGRDDLAVGSPEEDVGSVMIAGAVTILYGSGSGLSTTSQQFSQNGAVAGASELADRFGSALATEDIDGDGRDDLLIGAKTEAVGILRSGAATLVFGEAR